MKSWRGSSQIGLEPGKSKERGEGIEESRTGKRAQAYTERNSRGIENGERAEEHQQEGDSRRAGERERESGRWRRKDEQVGGKQWSRRAGGECNGKIAVSAKKAPIVAVT
jgi:hypothetical protein